MKKKINPSLIVIALLASTVLTYCTKRDINASPAVNRITTEKGASASPLATHVLRVNGSPQGFLYDEFTGYYSNNNDRSVGEFCGATCTQRYLRYRFNHSTIPNSKITNVRLNLTIKPFFGSQWDPSYVQVQIPYASCNDAIPWGIITQDQYSSLVHCIENAYLVTTYSVSQGALQAFYQRDINTGTSPNFIALLQNPTDFTFGMFTLLTNNIVTIADISVDITYTD